MAERGPAAALYLHKGDESILLHHEIDLLTEKTNVTVEDPPTPLLQEGFGQGFEMASALYGIHKALEGSGGRSTLVLCFRSSRASESAEAPDPARRDEEE